MALFSRNEHRPWPVPRQPWVMQQRWHNLLFAHWPVDVAELRSLVPEPLEIDTFGGKAWLGIIPFRLTGVRLRWLPETPGVSHFTEINVRTYVTFGGKPGVLFLSMDANNRLATAIARPTFRVPYSYANVGIVQGEHGYEFFCERAADERPRAIFSGSYRPTSGIFRAEPGSVEQWLTERYCYYHVSHGRVYRCEIAHAPWPLQRATATFRENTMASSLGINLPPTEPSLLYAHRMDAAFWWVAKLSAVSYQQSAISYDRRPMADS